MLTNLLATIDGELPQGRVLTDEEDREMKEHITQKKFGVTIEKFTEAWKAGKFDYDKERHSVVFFLAKMLPEYWVE